VALRLIVDRERDVEKFEPEEYWTIEAELQNSVEHRKGKKEISFRANLHSVNGTRPELVNQAQAEEILKGLEKAVYEVGEVRQTRSQRKPAAPFTTSTLQQEASRKLNFTSRKTMSVAQQLYEGVTLGKEGEQGLITYMRTDSTNISAVAQEEARQVITERYGGHYLPETPPVYTKKSKNAQEAHEAVRPTSSLRDPESIKGFLTTEQIKLYRLIWQRFIASQMAPAQVDNTSVDVKAGPAKQAAAKRPYLFRATGSVIVFPGFLAVYQEGLDEGTEDELNKKALPPLQAGEILKLLNLSPDQHFTQPPPRYTEATLVKTLEELGIGRPSTYAPTLGTIQERYYVVKEEKKFVPTELGLLVNDLVVEFFPEIVDSSFTSNMENELDEIAGGEREWVPVLREFYQPFKGSVEKAETEMQKVSIEPELAGEDCEKCGRPMYVKMGRFGRFIACSGFPECRNAKPILRMLGMLCPKCGEGETVIRSTKKRRVFYGCSRYPECDFSVWERPLPEPCPVCSGLMTLSGKRNAKCTVCGHTMDYELPEAEEVAGRTRNQPSVAAPRSLLSQAVVDGITTADLEAEQEEDTPENSSEEEQERHAAAV
jgi:DNA topoisomerase-1